MLPIKHDTCMILQVTKLILFYFLKPICLEHVLKILKTHKPFHLVS